MDSVNTNSSASGIKKPISGQMISRVVDLQIINDRRNELYTQRNISVKANHKLKEKMDVKRERLGVEEAFNRLATVIDPTDLTLCNTSQYIHSLQMFNMLKTENASDSSLLGALLHDIGKIKIFNNELSIFEIGGSKEPIFDSTGQFLEWQITHDDIPVQFLTDNGHTAEAFLIGSHSIHPSNWHLINGMTPELLEQFKQFVRADSESKSSTVFPDIAFQEAVEFVTDRIGKYIVL